MNLDLQVPYGYTTATRSLAWVRDWLLAHHHPEYVRRILPWLESKGGAVGIGGGFRSDGSQPNLSGFAPEGKSFHQNQKFNDGFIGAAAVDLVAKDGSDANSSHDSPPWSMVPAQGSAEAKLWGVHCNISTESWHMQPVEIDGWQTWTNAGCPSPKPNYPLPGGTPLPPADDLIDAAPPASLQINQPDNADTRTRTRWLQQICNERFGGRLGVDGFFGETTKVGVQRMQTIIGASSDGQYGPRTATALALWLGAH